MTEQENSGELPFTGERFTPSKQLYGSQIYFEHLHRYVLASHLVKGRSVLDIASGEGYGSCLLAVSGAESVVGVDISKEAIEHASRKYVRTNLKFLEGSCLEIPLKDGSVDIVVSFETIEHIEEHDQFIAEVKRVLRSDGILIVSSPNKEEYAKRGEEENRFHRKELSAAEFKSYLENSFKHVRRYSQRLVAGSYIVEEVGPSTLSVTGYFSGGLDGGKFDTGLPEGLYSVAVCADVPIGLLPSGVFEDRAISAKIWNEHELASVWLAEKEKLERQAVGSGAEAAETSSLRARVMQLEKELEERGVWGKSLDAEIETLRRALEAKEYSSSILSGRLNCQIADLRGEIARLVEVNDALRGEREILKKSLNAAEIERERGLTESQLKIAELEARNYSSSILAGTLNSQLTELRGATARFAEVNEALRAERESLMNSMNAAEIQSERGLAELQAKIAELEAKARRTSVEKSLIAEQFEGLLKEQIAQQKVQVAALLFSHESELIRVHREKLVLQTSLSQCEQDREARRAELQEAIREREEQLHEAQGQLRTALEQARSSSTTLPQLQADLKSERATNVANVNASIELKQIKSSWSWRITAPLRRFHQLLGDPLYKKNNK